MDQTLKYDPKKNINLGPNVEDLPRDYTMLKKSVERYSHEDSMDIEYTTECNQYTTDCTQSNWKPKQNVSAAN